LANLKKSSPLTPSDGKSSHCLLQGELKINSDSLYAFKLALIDFIQT
jgi:hypothetical protein